MPRPHFDTICALIQKDKMKRMLLVLFLTGLAGCTTVSELQRMDRGEGRQILFDLNQDQMRWIAEEAFKACGIEVKRVNYRSDRVEILGDQPESFGEHGAIYGLYLYEIGDSQTEAFLVRKQRYPSDVFSSDLRDAIETKLDELVLEKTLSPEKRT